jgi:hypothetical protein
VKIGSRLLFDLIVRLILLFFAIYFAVTPEALPGASVIARIGISAVFLVLVVITGEVSAMRAQLHIILTSVLRARAELGGREPPDDQAAVDILVKALRTTTDETRDKIHRQLRRLTGQDLPPDPQAWEDWWSRNREGFKRK